MTEIVGFLIYGATPIILPVLIFSGITTEKEYLIQTRRK